MLEIYVCQDNSIHKNFIAKHINDYVTINSLNARLKYCCQTPEVLIEYLQNNIKYNNLYFLDIKYVGSSINGFQLANKLRKIDPRSYMAFITSQKEMCLAPYLYNLEVMDFILKDNILSICSRVNQCITTALTRNTDNLLINMGEQIAIKEGSQTTYLLTDDIILIRTATQQHRILIITSSDTKTIYGTIKEWALRLKPMFFLQSNSSEIINKKYIKKVDFHNRKIYMHNEIICCISKKYLDNFR